MNATPIRRRVKADASYTIHITLPPEMGDEVEVLVFASASKGAMSPESLAMAHLMDETGFARQVLASPEEDCWNEL